MAQLIIIGYKAVLQMNNRPGFCSLNTDIILLSHEKAGTVQQVWARSEVNALLKEYYSL